MTCHDGEVEHLSYGDAPSQQAELHRPDGRSHGTVVVLHGGFWRAEYDSALGRPLAESLASHGWTAVNLEYRRVGDGGGFPETFDDVSAGIDLLAELDDVDTTRVITLGHSAGGHLAVWAAGRSKLGERWPPRVDVTAAIAQAGVLDLRDAIERALGSQAVEDFLPTDEALDVADPIAHIPLDVPVRCIHGRGDTLVPIRQSRTYVDAARAAGGDAELIALDGGHFMHIDPMSVAWKVTLETLDAL